MGEYGIGDSPKWRMSKFSIHIASVFGYDSLYSYTIELVNLPVIPFGAAGNYFEFDAEFLF